MKVIVCTLDLRLEYYFFLEGRQNFLEWRLLPWQWRKVHDLTLLIIGIPKILSQKGQAGSRSILEGLDTLSYMLRLWTPVQTPGLRLA